MAWGTGDSAIRLNAEQEAAISKMTMEEIKEYMHGLAVEQNLAVRDGIDKSVLIPVDAPQPTKHARAVLLPDGSKKILQVEASDAAAAQAQLDKAEIELHRSLQQPTQQTQTQTRDSQTGRFVADDAAQKATEQQRAIELNELETKFRLGQITPAEYLEKTGAAEAAVQSFLEKHNVSIEDLQTQTEADSWSPFVQQFLAETDWPGTDYNRDLLGQWLADHQSVPSVEALHEGYKQLKSEGKLRPNEELEAARRQRDEINSATSVEQIRQVLRSPASSGMWNR